MLSQRSMPWGNELLANTNLYIHAVGCFITVIADILGTTPDVVNEKLKSVEGYTEDGQVIWAKVAEAFPEYHATMFTPYNNDLVLQALNVGNSVLVEVSATPIGGTGLHAVRYIGNGLCQDPWDGTEKPTDTYPNPTGYVIIQKVTIEATPPPETSAEPVGELNTYGLDDTNIASKQVVYDTWHEVTTGAFVRADEYVTFTNGVNEALGIDLNSDLAKVKETIAALKESFAKHVQESTVPDPTQVEGQGPAVAPQAPAVTITNLPAHEKQSFLDKIAAFEKEVKNLLGLE